MGFVVEYSYIAIWVTNNRLTCLSTNIHCQTLLLWNIIFTLQLQVRQRFQLNRIILRWCQQGKLFIFTIFHHKCTCNVIPISVIILNLYTALFCEINIPNNTRNCWNNTLIIIFKILRKLKSVWCWFKCYHNSFLLKDLYEFFESLCFWNIVVGDIWLLFMAREYHKWFSCMNFFNLLGCYVYEVGNYSKVNTVCYIEWALISSK